LRHLDTPTTVINILGMTVRGHPGTGMLVISTLFLLIILFYRKGIMGSNEFSWQWLSSKLPPIFKREGTEQGK
jgi:branched-chain amino acid transport system permease protein